MTTKQLELITHLFKEHTDSMVQLTYRRIGNAELAKELVQEAFLTACCKADKVCEHNNPVAWLYDTLGKLTMREREKAYYTAEIPIIDEELAGVTEMELPVEHYLPSGLSKKEKELIMMRIERDMSFAAIAEIKGINEAACRQQVSRAYRKCRQLLEQELATT